ncbi:MAG: phosphoribosyl-ATP diphosphatase [Pelagibacteraceae bacterium]|nr:phosphoribosyl-ATP diphosphatase [Pelagibacteraceae bacterium]|tara:strand:- start:7614 stop:7922 length:309 start_codon:yes stop_codon:yes gene_type:complete
MSTKVQVLVRLFETIINRSSDDPKSSYTAQLLSEGKEKCIAKLKEEALETVEAAEHNDRNQIIYESADLIYHLLVLWNKFEITPDQIYDELISREGKTGIRK